MLRLKFKRVNERLFSMCIVEQDEEHRGQPTGRKVFEAKNETVFRANEHPDFSRCVDDKRTLWLRGYLKGQDQNWFDVQADEFKALAEAVAEFNNRKNICEIADEGMIV